MPSELVPQVDIGTLSINGLRGFAPILAALSADDVAPMSLIQLEQLGSLFHINGRYAEKVPELLQRCSSHRLESLGITIGWQKGDTCSFMSKSAGGQAVALLCLCIMNLYSPEVSGGILYDLSERTLPQGASVSSIGQLSHTGKLLSSKLGPLGFGNILAKQVSRIIDTFTHLELPKPSDFFDPLTRESMVDLLEMIPAALAEQDTLVRIRGTQAMGHLATMFLVLCPADVMVTVAGYLIHEGTRRSIILEITSNDAPSPCTAQLEKHLPGHVPRIVPLGVESNINLELPTWYTFRWKNHVADSLSRGFLSVGGECPTQLKVACANISFYICVCTRGALALGRDKTSLPLKGLVGLLGNQPEQRMRQTCLDILGCQPSEISLDFPRWEPMLWRNKYTTADRALERILDETIRKLGLKCTCRNTEICGRDHLHDMIANVRYSGVASSTRSCRIRMLHRYVANAVCRVIQCFFITASENTSVSFDGAKIHDQLKFVEGVASHYMQTVYMSTAQIDEDVSRVVHESNIDGSLLASSSNGATLFAKSFSQLRYDLAEGHVYNLIDGNIIVKNRHYKCLVAPSTEPRTRATKSLIGDTKLMRPSASGVHSKLSFTLREMESNAYLRCFVEAKGQIVEVNLKNSVLAAMSLEDTLPCPHPVDVAMNVEGKTDVLSTAVVGPLAAGKKIAVTQTMGDPTAQLLACTAGTKALLQRNSCLACTIAEAKNLGVYQVIVAYH